MYGAIAQILSISLCWCESDGSTIFLIHSDTQDYDSVSVVRTHKPRENISKIMDSTQRRTFDVALRNLACFKTEQAGNSSLVKVADEVIAAADAFVVTLEEAEKKREKNKANMMEMLAEAMATKAVEFGGSNGGMTFGGTTGGTFGGLKGTPAFGGRVLPS